MYNDIKEVSDMATAQTPNVKMEKISVTIPKSKAHHNVLPRLREVGEEKDRSLNYLVVEAILEYLEREEKEA